MRPNQQETGATTTIFNIFHMGILPSSSVLLRRAAITDRLEQKTIYFKRIMHQVQHSVTAPVASSFWFCVTNHQLNCNPRLIAYDFQSRSNSCTMFSLVLLLL